MRQAYTVSVEGTNSLGNFGIAGNLGYQHKNIFKSGELLDVTLLGATERQSYGTGDSATTFHSFEAGIDTKLTLPKYLAPIRTKGLFRYSTPQTLMDFSYNYQDRPDYTRTIFRASFGYQWKTSDYTTHRFNILDLNLIKMFSYNQAFISRIENLSIKSSYTDHSISSWNYSYTYNTQNIQKRTEYTFLRANVETAGNLLYGFNKLFNRSAYTSNSFSGSKYYFLATPFAQYAMTDLEYRRGIVLDKYNMLAIRAFGGIVVPYGNSDQVPFERKYFTGGANGIRAWPVRTLGPGSYKADPNEFPNQTGDIKLEANAEYRFAIISDFEGALFLDAGNIWSLKDNRPGTEFRWTDGKGINENAFYKDIAIGTGLGLRYDFAYVILRVDLGFKLHDPTLDEGSRWIPFSRFLNKSNYNIAFGIGYPF
jgi:outer membrane protein assembly factor BamA